ncbi:ABC transporter substrate-binding protein [Telmatospirillum sp.]|uniref:ABC transporter substrate-binding protein n=1 Tax=Telmatospirillum sp. TaxID=2079197 RepID=UPI002849F3E9|nr:ABC transporter substrate-binding protein [Telmatospirillum sp.]MDR3436085.1 ABC transporter substrate-binding protein [Telmatospirillum sp.]
MNGLPLAAVLFGLTLLAGDPAKAAGPMKIGAILSQTGALADYGPATANAIALAVAEINSAGGVLGAPLAEATADDRSEAQGAVAASQRLAGTDKVSAFVGPMSSAAFLAVASTVAAPQGLPMISGSATATMIDSLDSKGFAFRTVPSDLQQGAALAQVAHDKGYRTVAIAAVNTDYGKGLAQSFTSSFTKIGGKVTATVPFEAKQAGSHDEVQKAAAGHADALLVIAYPADGATQVKAALDGGFFNKFLLSDGLLDPNVIETVGGQFLDGVAGATAATAADSEGRKTFEKAYAAKFGAIPPVPYLDRTYDAVWLLALAAEKAKSTEGAKIRDVLRDITGDSGEKIGPSDFAKAKQLIAQGKKIYYSGAAGPYVFDAHGGVTGTFAHWQIQDGKFDTVRLFTPKL